jgi:hypothetical protein
MLPVLRRISVAAASPLLLAACASCSSTAADGAPRTLSGLTVAPDSFTLGVGLERQAEATAAYSDGTTRDQTGLVTWTSSAPGNATVVTGRIVGVSPGTALVVAQLGEFRDTAVVTISAQAPTLADLQVAPSSATIPVDGTRKLTATALYSDQGSTDVTAEAAWASTAPAVATVDAGAVRGHSPGTTSIVASFVDHADTAAITVEPAEEAGHRFPLKVGPGGRHLVDQDGVPFLVVGDGAWSLIAQLTDEEIDRYLDKRRDYGFNALIVNLIEHKAADKAPRDIYGTAPFTGAAFTTPNEAYFSRVDHILQSAADRGMVVLLAPLYVGFACGDDGWAAELRNSSLADLTSWGTYLGTRYQGADNLVWMIGGDVDPGNCSAKPKLEAMVAGIQAHDTRHLFTAHNGRTQMAITPWPTASWLTLNNIYTDGLEYQYSAAAYAALPTRPFFMVEGYYEGDSHNQSQAQLRSQSYWTVLSGGVGQVYGGCPMWHFGATYGLEFCASSDWEGQLTSQGARNMRYMARLFGARHWDKLVPDVTGAVLTAGAGSGAARAVAAVASDGSSIIAYLPTQRQVTVLPATRLGATYNAWWYNPATGISTAIGSGPLAAQTPLVVTPPGSGDWVLVLDNPAFGFAEP